MHTININKRPRSRTELPDWYSAVLDDQANSGLSMAEYADELGLTPATLYQWKRRLSEDEEDRAEFETPSSMGLVEVAVEGLPSTGRQEPLIIRLGRNRFVEVPRRFDDADLIRLLEILEAC